MAIEIKIEPQEFQTVYNPIRLVLDSTSKGNPKFTYLVDILIDGDFKSQIEVENNLDGYGVVDLHKHIEPFVSFNVPTPTTEILEKIADSYTGYSVELAESYVLNTSFDSVFNNAGTGFAQFNFVTENYYEVGDVITIKGTNNTLYDGEVTVTAIGNYFVVTDTAYINTAIGGTTRADGGVTKIDSDVVMTGDKFAFNGVLDWVDVPNWDYTDYTTNPSKFLCTLPLEGNKVRMDDLLYCNIININSYN